MYALSDAASAGPQFDASEDPARRRRSPTETHDLESHVAHITCTRCGEEAEPLPKPPFRNELGERIREEICQSCWAEWLQHQTLLINHYGLDVRDPKARQFLYDKIEKLLLGGGTDEEIDTALEGQIEW